LNIDRDKPKIVEPKKKKKKQPSLQEVPAETEEQTQEKSQQEEEKVPDGQSQAQPNYVQVDPSEIKDTNIPYYDPNLYDLYEPNIDEMTKNIPHSTAPETVLHSV